jgi:hypothetical protein
MCVLEDERPSPVGMDEYSQVGGIVKSTLGGGYYSAATGVTIRNPMW